MTLKTMEILQQTVLEHSQAVSAGAVDDDKNELHPQAVSRSSSENNEGDSDDNDGDSDA